MGCVTENWVLKFVLRIPMKILGNLISHYVARKTMILGHPSLLREDLVMFKISSILQLKYQNSGEESNEDEELINLESVRALEGVALQHGFVGRLVINPVTFPRISIRARHWMN